MVIYVQKLYVKLLKFFVKNWAEKFYRKLIDFWEVSVNCLKENPIPSLVKCRLEIQLW